MISIAKPYIGPEEQAAVAETLASGILASGPRVHQFERVFADYCHSPGGVACSSGTSGLCAAVAALDIPAGSKILTTPFTFIATANCILYGGYQPVFVDVDPDTFMPSAAAIEAALASDPAIRAVIPVHLYGQACEIHQIVEIARAHHAYVIEDCAQAHGAMEHGVPVGAIGDLGVFSFYPTKNMTTGEGGIITGRNTEFLERCRLIIDHGSPERYRHIMLGYNCRMTSIAAAIGLTQFERLPAWTETRRRNAHALSAGLAGLPWLTVPFERVDCQHVFHQYVLKVQDRDRFQAYLQAAGVGTAVHYPCTLADQPFYASMGYRGSDYPVAVDLAAKVLSLPVHPAVTKQDIRTIISTVRAFTPIDTAPSVTLSRSVS